MPTTTQFEITDGMLVVWNRECNEPSDQRTVERLLVSRHGLEPMTAHRTASPHIVALSRGGKPLMSESGRQQQVVTRFLLPEPKM